MFIDKLPQLTKDQIDSVEWQGDAHAYDLELSELGSHYSKVIVKNHHAENQRAVYFIDQLPENPEKKCVIWHYRNEWVAKLFYKGWQPEDGYLEIQIPVPQLTWRKNPDIDFSMTFYDTPLNNFEPDPWDCDYTMVWYMDPAFNPTEDKIWVMTCEVLGVSGGGIKDMGYLTPNISIEFNDNLPKFELDLETIMPPYWDLSYECAYYLDCEYIPTDEKMWLVKIVPNYRKTKDWKWIGGISVEPKVIYNLDYGILKYDLDLSVITLDDLRYECVWYFDKKHLDDVNDDDVWAFKIIFSSEPEGLKFMDYISPEPLLTYNPDLEHLDIDYGFLESYDHKLKDFFNCYVWMTNPSKINNNSKIWLAKASLISDYQEEINQGFVNLYASNFDVFFISYDEPGADENYKRLLTRAPEAKRITGVKGILEAHKAAAEQSSSEMFYVVDADAWIENDFNFDFKPSIFDYDCVHVWQSRNPFIDRQYGYGGVKLFPTEEVKMMTEWTNDLTTSVGDKFKIINKISNTTKFNTSPLHAYRSAYRECAKLAAMATDESKQRLHAWLKPNKSAEYSEFAARGAKDGVAHFLLNKDMSLINDYDFLEQQFKDLYGR